ncbi:MAG: molybdopterin molybdotransferase MoeA [Desulfobacteraceae bacterium]|nr:molybdopterin molybdotransferase MoeA [Desulfobacteraceae bacterium]MBC2756302.1 molybdopterin molybdotransferase MoeA [Desulfobacteraceae bacterium]
MTLYDIGFHEAMRLSMTHSGTIGAETISVLKAAGRVVAQDVLAVVDSPSVDASLKDGYAVVSGDIVDASKDNPVKLMVIDSVAAGDQSGHRLCSGETIRILTGAPLPKGAQAVLIEEFTSNNGEFIYAHADAAPGRNVLEKGVDVKCGQTLVQTGETLIPQQISLMIAGGVSDVRVYKKPIIGLLATGSEVIMPGQPMTPGKVYASNVGLQQAWLTMLGFEVRVLSAVDSVDRIAESMLDLNKTCDVVLTSGGAWKGDRDLIATVIDSLGGKMVFHRLRMGPGKASGMGFLNNKPVFCLPGGPSSNMFGFVMIVLPALFKITGTDRCPHLSFEGKLEKEITGQADWTNLVQCDIVKNGPDILLCPRKLKSRLVAMATNHAIVVIPEGVEKFAAGDTVPFICLHTELFAYQV